MKTSTLKGDVASEGMLNSKEIQLKCHYFSLA